LKVTRVNWHRRFWENRKRKGARSRKRQIIIRGPISGVRMLNRGEFHQPGVSVEAIL
jgi:hypothetical protein